MSGFWQLAGVANMPVNQQGQKQRTIRKTFAPQKRGRPSFSLNSPTKVNTPPPVLRDIYALLAPKPRAKTPRFRGVAGPVVVNPFVPPSLVYTDAITVLLARQKRGKTKPSVLRSPTVVAVRAPVLRKQPVVFSPGRRGRGYFVPVRPIVVFAPARALGWVATNLVQTRNARQTTTLLRPPTVTN